MEIEFKFAVPKARLEALQRDMQAGETTRTPLQARYFDTPDAALAAHGVVLRLRREGTQWVQTAKAVVAGQGPLHRLEHNAVLDADAATGPAAMPDPARHGDTPVGALLQKALGASRESLVETMSTDIWRLARHETVEGSTVELALDVGQVMGGSPGGPRATSEVCELELELVHGRVEDLVPLAADWARRHGLWFSTLSKAERGHRLAGEPGVSHAVKATAPHFPDDGKPHRAKDKAGKTGKAGEGSRKDKKRQEGKTGCMTGPAVQRAVVAACLAQVLPNASEIASGNHAAEVVHQLRVGIRRLRTALRELAVLTPQHPGLQRFDEGWSPVLQRVFQALGAQRDQEMTAAAVEPRLDEAGAPARMSSAADLADAPPAAPPADIGDAVRSPDFQAALIGMIGFTVADDGDSDGEGDGGDGGDGRDGGDGGVTRGRASAGPSPRAAQAPFPLASPGAA